MDCPAAATNADQKLMQIRAEEDQQLEGLGRSPRAPDHGGDGAVADLSHRITEDLSASRSFRGPSSADRDRANSHHRNPHGGASRHPLRCTPPFHPDDPTMDEMPFDRLYGKG